MIGISRCCDSRKLQRCYAVLLSQRRQEPAGGGSWGRRSRLGVGAGGRGQGGGWGKRSQLGVRAAGRWRAVLGLRGAAA